MPPEPFDLNRYIMHHVLNSQEWHLPFLPPIHLPKPLSVHALMVIIWTIAMIWILVLFIREMQNIHKELQTRSKP